MKAKFRISIVLMLLSSPDFIGAQCRLDLRDAINIHIYKTNNVQKAKLTYDNAQLEYANYQKSFLPSLSTNITPISFSHSMKLLQNYNNGEYTNVNENTNAINGSLAISQLIGPTNGTLTVASSINWLREFTSNNNSFSTSPLYISYSQQLMGGNKKYLYTQKLQKLKNTLATQNYVASISSEQITVLALYLDAYSKWLEVNLYKKISETSDTLTKISEMKKNAGMITESEFTQISLQQVSAEITLKQARFSYDKSIRQLENELNINDIEIVKPHYNDLPLSIDASDVASIIMRNNPSVLSDEIAKKNAEYSLYLSKLATRFNADLSMSYGFNQYANNFMDSYRNPDSRQNVNVTLAIPVFQWGINHNKRRMALNEYNSIILSIEDNKKKIKEEIESYVFSYNHNREIVELAEAKCKLAQEVYSTEVMKYINGKTSAIELSNASKDCIQSNQELFSTIKSLFNSYYQLRHYSLYDFAKKNDLVNILELNGK